MAIISSISLYLAVIFISCFFLRHLVGQGRAAISHKYVIKGIYIDNNCKIMFTCLICILPVVLLYTLRVGIGSDYWAYERSYHVLHSTGFFQYFSSHKGALNNSNTFYVEPGYYLLTRIAPSYFALQFLNALLIFIPIFRAIFICRTNISPNFAFFIFYSTQFLCTINIVRFAIALSFILLAFVYLLHDKDLKFLVCIVIAAMFHTSAWLVLLYFFVKEFKSKLLNFIRDILLIVGTLFVPYIGKIIYTLGSFIPQFDRLYRLYPLQNYTPTSRWWIHFVPAILPFLLILGKKMFETKEERTMFRIFITEAPLRLFIYYNKWFGRLCRIPQIIQVIYIPYMLKKVKNPQDRKLLLLYSIAWYVFYFLFNLFTYDNSKIYQSIFG